MADSEHRRGGLTAEALEQRFSVRKRARADGSSGAPPENAADWSQTERDVLAAVAAQRQETEAARIAAGARAEEDMRRLAPAAIEMESPCAEARLALRLVEGRLAADYREARARAQRSAAELDGFRRVHELRRPAIYPDSRVLQAGLLFCAAAFEAVFSAALFAANDERGLMGGAITALGLSGANVSLGFLAGFLGLRYLAHARLAPRVLGGLGLAVLFALSVSFNLFAAQWRDKLGAGEKTPLELADAASWFGLIAPQAVILIMLGAGVWMFSALKGYSGFDDPYPDYGKLDRAARDAGEDFAELRTETRAALEAPVETARAAITARLEAASESLARMRARFDAAASEIQALDAQARRSAESGVSVIALYRRENLAARNGAAAPLYFSADAPLPAHFTDALASAGETRMAGERAFAQAQAAAAEKLAELAAELDAVTARLDGAP